MPFPSILLNFNNKFLHHHYFNKNISLKLIIIKQAIKINLTKFKKTIKVIRKNRICQIKNYKNNKKLIKNKIIKKISVIVKVEAAVVAVRRMRKKK